MRNGLGRRHGSDTKIVHVGFHTSGRKRDEYESSILESSRVASK